MVRILIVLLAGVSVVAGCSDRVDPKPWELNNGTTTSNNTTANNTTSNNTTANNTTGCGVGFDCVQSCATDYFWGSECVDGRQQCPDGGWFPIADCPPGSCFGLPFPGEVCDNGFQCRPSPDVLDSCPEQMCATCQGFDPSIHSTPQCQCRCDDDGNVRCHQPMDCVVTNESDLPGVTLRLVGDRCAWSVDELAEGVTIAYEVVVDEALAPATVVPQPQDAGGCGQPGPSGLITSFRISSAEGDNYCLCDTGLCASNMMEVALAPGVHPGELQWFGANWGGPSDTGNPMGPPFAADAATVEVTAIGIREDGTPFRVATSMPIQLLR